MHKMSLMTNPLYSTFTEKEPFFRWSFWIVGLSLVAGLILSILSWLELCVEHCSVNRDYLLFGLPFAIAGMLFFSVLTILHILSKSYLFLSKLVGWSVAAALGSEIMFIAVQKYQIGHWCPVCLSIAATVAVINLVFFADYLRNLIIQRHNPGDAMNRIKQGLPSLSFIFLGFLLAFLGISKPDSAQAEINDMKERLAFGKKNSAVVVYVITDWFCPACKKIEPEFEKLYPEIASKATIYFVDYPIHKKSLNFTPYNLAFLIHNKSQYFKARHALADLTTKTETPTDNDIIKEANRYRIAFNELTFLDVKNGIDFFDKISEKYNLQATPTIIITNTHKNLTTKFEGSDEFNPEKILKTIEKLNK